MCKRCPNIFIFVKTLKKDLFGCFKIKKIRDKDNATGLKEGGGIEMSTTVLPLRDARSIRFVFTYLLTKDDVSFLLF